jgi:ABC-type sugar transport system permease subunit
VRKARASSSQESVGYLMIAPFYLFLFFMILVPVVMNILLSLTDYDLRTLHYVGLRNYAHMLNDSFFWTSAANTGRYTLFTLALSMGLGLAFAVLLNRNLPGRKLFRTALFIPFVTSMVSISMIWLWIYDPSNGILNVALSLFGIPKQKWLYDPNLAMGSIIAMSVWKLTGDNMVVFLAGLQSIPEYLYEAATIDGASFGRQFSAITIPLLRPVTFFLFVTGMIFNFNVFEQVKVMTDGGPNNSTTTIVHQIYDRAFNDFQMGYGSAMAVVLLVAIAILTLVNFRFGEAGTDVGIG